MPDTSSKSSTAQAPDSAIAQIVQMNPRRVTVTLTLPVSGGEGRPTVTLEWSREDTTMPLSDLLLRIESYVSRFGSK
ncbi:MAG: hypothetical protein L3J95_02540 [Thermoplasmata archaeon]|jgi:hypothetical protein|nr:hypothetical protein [Thermoplasmata archaeon]MCI4359285.1 hypothetical protein [Thermoplasmata archaeon]